MSERRALPEPVQAAVSELQTLIAQHFPTASFRIGCGVDDPQQTFLVATVDVEDPDQVMDVVLERLLELTLDQGIPVNVVPVHTPERVAETRRRIAAKHGGTRPVLPPLPSA